MKYLFFIIAIISTLLFSWVPCTEAQITAVYTENPVNLDGVLNEADWAKVTPTTEFYQQELIEGAPISERTELRIMYDKNNIYVGVKCFDSEPDKIIHKALMIGTGLEGDDQIRITLDTYNDNRAGYYFAANPNGATSDGTFLGGDSQVNSVWDGIWHTRSHISEIGWTCEMVIPFKTLRFPATENQVWGFNFLRNIRRKNEESFWKAWKRNEGLTMLSKDGTLTIPGNFSAGKQLDVMPYALGGVENESGDKNESTFKGGIDFKYGITTNTTLDITLNTDFAQIESDTEVVNLTQYDLSYPEQRPFFLENSELFTFSQGMNNAFYSRNIGITPDLDSVPILGGVKLSQKRGKFNLGILSVQTDEVDRYSGANYSVIRMKRDLFKQSYIGAIATNVYNDNPLAGNAYRSNFAAGADLILRTDSFMGDKNLELQSYLVGSVIDGSAHESLSGRIYVAYPNDIFHAYMLYHALGNEYDPGIGYISRDAGCQQYMGRFQYNPRPNIPFIKQFQFEPLMFNYYTDTHRRMIDRTLEFSPLGFTTNSDDKFKVEITNEYEIVDNNSGIFGNDPNDLVPFGAYEWVEYEAEFSSSSRRMFTVDLGTTTGDFYNGTRNGYDAEFGVNTSPHYRVTANANYNNLSFGNRNIIKRYYGSRLYLYFNVRTSATTFVQYNNDTGEVNVNFRFHYIPKIGSDIYIVYNHLMDETQNYTTLQSMAMLKINATIRF